MFSIFQYLVPMPEVAHERKIFSLTEVSASIERTLYERYKKSFWVKAEIIKLNHYPHSGHCYPDLTEKRENKIVAQMRSTLWKADYLRINKKFLKVIGEPLKSGIQVLLEVQIVFDAVHGVALHILDIDPSFSLGEMERDKMETILRLKEEGLFDENKRLSLPLLPQRLAVISVETSKGYADFTSILGNNPNGYRFQWMLFPSILQGDVAVKGIITQLNRVRRAIDHFDAVVIVRGGGGDVGLTCYNHYDMARAIATFPLPVLTGIGHATNETVVEMIAHRNAITPTELANFLITRLDDFARPVNQAQQLIAARVKSRLSRERQQMDSTARMLSVLVNRSLERGENSINGLEIQLRQQIQLLFSKQQNRLESSENTIRLCSPDNVLKRGYSMLLKDGKAVSGIENISVNDEITAVLHDGQVKTKVLQIKKNRPNE